jgi:hypothetical protein
MTDYDDSLDRQWQEEQEFQEMEEMNQRVQRYNARKQAQANQAAQNQMFQKALDKHGLTPDEFQQISQLDPQFYNQAYEDGLDNLVRTVKTRARDPRTGQFVKQSQARPRQADPHAAHYTADQSRIDAIKEKGRRQGLHEDSDIEALLDDAIGKLF